MILPPLPCSFVRQTLSKSLTPWNHYDLKKADSFFIQGSKTLARLLSRPSFLFEEVDPLWPNVVAVSLPSYESSTPVIWISKRTFVALPRNSELVALAGLRALIRIWYLSSCFGDVFRNVVSCPRIACFSYYSSTSHVSWFTSLIKLYLPLGQGTRNAFTYLAGRLMPCLRGTHLQDETYFSKIASFMPCSGLIDKGVPARQDKNFLPTCSWKVEYIVHFSPKPSPKYSHLSLSLSLGHLSLPHSKCSICSVLLRPTL